MSTAEATTEGTSPAPAGPDEKPDATSPHEQGAAPTRSRVPPASPVLTAGWLVRAAAFSAIAAGAMGLIIAPGVRGNASEQVVVAMDRTAAALTYLTVELLVTLLLWGALELARTHALGIFVRVALIGGGAAVIAMSAPGLRERLPPAYAVLIAAAATVATIAGGYVSARAPNTRALAGVLFLLAFAALARLGAWELATAAGDRASVQLFGVSRGLATTGVLFEASAQMVAVTWMATRSRSAGQLASTAALIAAIVVTWGVARGMHSGPELWEVVLRTALADAPGVPRPYGLDAIATFLVPASLLLALASVAQPNEVVAIVATMALALVSRGALDAPVRALCAVAASQWAALAWADERVMWGRSS